MQRYTLPQIEAFIQAVADEEKATTRQMMIACRAAQAEGKAFKKILKEYS